MRSTFVGLGLTLMMATAVASWDATVPARAATQPAACPPLQLSDIEDYVDVKAPVAVVRRRVAECGLGFAFDKTAEDRLRTLGAQADLIAMLTNLGRAGLEVRSTPAGATVTVDGQRRGTTPLTLNDLAPGAHKLLLSFEGYLDNASEVTTKAGDTERIERNLTRTPAQAAPAVAAPKGGSKLPWIIGGVAAVGGGAAIALGGGGGDKGTSTAPTSTPTTTTVPVSSVNISRTAFTFGFAGGSLQADVTCAGCSWAFGGIPSWFTVQPASGTGNNTVTVRADANTAENGSTNTRSVVFTVGSTNLTASQDGLTCTNTVATRDNLTSVGNGGTVNAAQNDRFFTIVTAAECRWTGRTSTSWMTFRENGATTVSGTGPRVGEDNAGTKLAVVFQPNTGARRTGTITIASTNFSVIQCASTETSC
jgi:PEGA domain